MALINTLCIVYLYNIICIYNKQFKWRFKNENLKLIKICEHKNKNIVSSKFPWESGESTLVQPIFDNSDFYSFGLIFFVSNIYQLKNSHIYNIQ